MDKELLKKLVPKASNKTIDTFVEPLTKAMSEFSINSNYRIAAFIAQIAHESGNLYYVKELASGSAYEHRRDLGNLEQEALDYAHNARSTTGRFYKGRGLIQITGFFNYAACERSLHIPLRQSPELLEQPINAARSAAWFWDKHDLNAYADVQLFEKITYTINGGYNGADERNANYARCKLILNCK